VRTFSALVGRKVETESGLSLGRCHDLRGELSGSRLEVVAMCVGSAGLLDRLGIRTRAHDEVAWSSIVRIHGDRIVVRDP
jgi:sporulation protein YlmC with PRC-barrel domain